MDKLRSEVEEELRPTIEKELRSEIKKELSENFENKIQDFKEKATAKAMRKMDDKVEEDRLEGRSEGREQAKEELDDVFSKASQLFGSINMFHFFFTQFLMYDPPTFKRDQFISEEELASLNHIFLQ
jgi:uncharacterized membrane protein YheB (UPF0754 family)